MEAVLVAFLLGALVMYFAKNSLVAIIDKDIAVLKADLSRKAAPAAAAASGASGATGPTGASGPVTTKPTA